MCKHWSARIILFSALSLSIRSGAQELQPEHSWGYDGALGPSHWVDLKAEFATCKTGHHQSPIDIRNPEKASLAPIHFNYESSPLHIIDNGHTIMVNYRLGSFIRVGDKKYSLKQFHFHRPSEKSTAGAST